MKNNQAFSLLELSIVLTIIAIIVSGISISGRFVKLSQLNNVIAEVNTYHSYMRIFKLKYDYYAGDFPDAGAMWGNDCNGSSSGSDLCSGNGNGALNTGTPDETYKAWQHLYRADILKEFYPFSGSSSVEQAALSALNNSSIYFFETINGKLVVSLRTKTSAYNALSHKDAYIIDNKIDDGVLNSGDVTGECGSGITTYDFTLDDMPRCNLKFK